MDRRKKASLNRHKAAELNEKWRVGAEQPRYSHDGHWYATLTRFPAALIDANGYLVFASEEEYRDSPYIRTGKQIGVPKPGISAIPGYVRVEKQNTAQPGEVDIHASEAKEGKRQLKLHLTRERNQKLVRMKKEHARSLS